MEETIEPKLQLSFILGLGMVEQHIYVYFEQVIYMSIVLKVGAYTQSHVRFFFITVDVGNLEVNTMVDNLDTNLMWLDDLYSNGSGG